MIERRPGGETGVVSVQCLEGDAVWKARDEGRWSGELALAACAEIANKPAGSMEEHCKNPTVFLVEHSDGLKTATLMLYGYVSAFAYAARVNGQVHGMEFHLQEGGPYAHFSYLCRNVQQFFATGKAPYPLARTLLTTGLIDAGMNSRYEEQCLIETPFLNIAYESYDELPTRPLGTRPKGACIDPEAADIV
jgi:hypothetical protein